MPNGLHHDLSKVANLAIALNVLYATATQFRVIGKRTHVGALVPTAGTFFVGVCHRPAFNIADAAILAGAVCLIIDAFFINDESSKEMKI